MKVLLLCIAFFAILSVVLGGVQGESHREGKYYDRFSPALTTYDVLRYTELPKCCIDAVGLRNYIDKRAGKTLEEIAFYALQKAIE